MSVSGGCIVAFTDGRRDVEDRMARDWCGLRGGEGCILVVIVAIVYDGEIACMRLALASRPVVPLQLLWDSNTAIAGVWNTASSHTARTADLRAMVDLAGCLGE